MRASRDLRIGLSQTHANPLKWMGMAFLGFLTLLSLAVVHADNARAALVAIVFSRSPRRPRRRSSSFTEIRSSGLRRRQPARSPRRCRPNKVELRRSIAPKNGRSPVEPR